MTLLAVDGLEMRFGDRLIQTGISFTVEKGSIFAIIGGSGCGKSTLLKHLVGLLPPAAGTVKYNGVDFWAANDTERNRMRAGFGMLFQSAALWSSMTLLENVCLPMERQGTCASDDGTDPAGGAGGRTTGPKRPPIVDSPMRGQSPPHQIRRVGDAKLASSRGELSGRRAVRTNPTWAQRPGSEVDAAHHLRHRDRLG